MGACVSPNDERWMDMIVYFIMHMISQFEWITTKKVIIHLIDSFIIIISIFFDYYYFFLMDCVKRERSVWVNGFGHTTMNTPRPIPNREAKHRRARLVLGWVTTWESRVLNPFFLNLSKIIVMFYLYIYLHLSFQYPTRSITKAISNFIIYYYFNFIILILYNNNFPQLLERKKEKTQVNHLFLIFIFLFYFFTMILLWVFQFAVYSREFF